MQRRGKVIQLLHLLFRIEDEQNNSRLECLQKGNKIVKIIVANGNLSRVGLSALSASMLRLLRRLLKSSEVALVVDADGQSLLGK